MKCEILQERKKGKMFTNFCWKFFYKNEIDEKDFALFVIEWVERTFAKLYVPKMQFVSLQTQLDSLRDDEKLPAILLGNIL